MTQHQQPGEIPPPVRATPPGAGPRAWWRAMFGSRDVASCRQAGRALQAYLDGALDAGSARRVSRHLETCRRCGLEAETYAAIKATLARGGREVDPHVVSRLQDFGARLVDTDPGER